MWILLSRDISNSEHKVATERQIRKEYRKYASACLITSILVIELADMFTNTYGRLSSSLQVVWKFLESGIRHIVTS
jgi:hypothetical protein